MQPRRILFSAQKDEGPFITEWVAFHQVIGFTDIVVVSNDCSDGSDALLDALTDAGAVTHLRQEVPADMAPQTHAEVIARQRYDFRQGDWIMWLDLDEFLIPFVPGHQVSGVIDAMEGADALMVGWRFFGDAEVSEFPGRQYSPVFNRAAPHRKGRSGQVKTLFRLTDAIDRFDIHRPLLVPGAGPESYRVIQSSGRPAEPSFYEQGRGRAANRLDGGRAPHRLAMVAHYAVRSPDMFARRKSRGDGYYADRGASLPQHDDLYARRNFNQLEETGHLMMYDATTERMQQLLSIDAVRDAHLAAGGALL